MPIFSFFPSSLSAWHSLQQFHRLVNEADFSVFDGDGRIFAIIVVPKPAQWMRNTNLVTLQRQILNWIAAWSKLQYGKLPHDDTTTLPPGIREEVESIKREHYDHARFTDSNLWETNYTEGQDELIHHYEETSKKLTGASPPNILRLRRFELDFAHKAWGLDESFIFPYRYAYFTERDWNRIIIQGVVDDLNRSESSGEAWQKIKHTFNSYPSSHKHTFNVLADEVQKGFIYLLRGEDSGYYKIGFTTSENPYSRRRSLQTGSAERLAPAGYFSAASAKTEQTIRLLFAAKRARNDGEWYILTQQDVDNLLDEVWRLRNNIY
jgi:hypothetical protein